MIYNALHHRSRTLIYNAEIHITRADPAKHGRKGFVCTVTWADQHHSNPTVFDTRAMAAIAGALHLEHVEDQH